MIQSLAGFVIARSVATKQSSLSFNGAMDCFASLAMTGFEGVSMTSEQRR